MKKQRTGSRSSGIVQISGNVIDSVVIVIGRNCHKLAAPNCATTLDEILYAANFLKGRKRKQLLAFLTQKFGAQKICELNKRQLRQVMQYIKKLHS